MGVYTLNSNDITLKNNQFDIGIPEDASIANEENGFGKDIFKAVGYLDMKLHHRVRGVNAIRIHGTKDSDFLIDANTFGTSFPAVGPIRAIHIHGSSPSSRTEPVPTKFIDANDKILKLTSFLSKNDGARRRFIVSRNSILHAHEAGIDVRGEQGDVEISHNSISNVKRGFWGGSDNAGIGIKMVGHSTLFQQLLSRSDSSIKAA